MKSVKARVKSPTVASGNAFTRLVWKPSGISPSASPGAVGPKPTRPMRPWASPRSFSTSATLPPPAPGRTSGTQTSKPRRWLSKIRLMRDPPNASSTGSLFAGSTTTASRKSSIR